VIIGAKLKGPDEPPPDEDDPPPKLRVGLDSLEAVDLELSEDIDDDDEEVTIACSGEGAERIRSRLRRRL
jgi:hypothetical protein